VTDGEFAAAMAWLGPFEPAPNVAVAVSGGADSLALTVLADVWARARGGAVVGLVVDHGLRAAAAVEAGATERLLGRRGIAAHVLRLTGLVAGSALAERARVARYAALVGACEAAGVVHLLVGHHAADQAETVAARALRGSFSAGLAGMARLVELPTVRVLRPLLGVKPGALRALLLARGIEWIEDPSNRDKRALRVRLRLLAGERDSGDRDGRERDRRRRDIGDRDVSDRDVGNWDVGNWDVGNWDVGGRDGSGVALVAAAAVVAGAARATAERQAADVLGRVASVRPEGFAVIADGAMPPVALGALIQAVAGAPYPPSPQAVATLAASPAPATLGGTRLLPAGRLGPGLLLVREAAAMAPPTPAVPGAVWDGRYRLARNATPPAGATLGALDADAGLFRSRSKLPAAVLRTLPALRSGATLLAVPHLRYPDPETCSRLSVLFAPPHPAAGAPFRTG
jgi:tRNA(Ile)-lysidine synthase